MKRHHDKEVGAAHAHHPRPIENQLRNYRSTAPDCRSSLTKRRARVHPLVSSSFTCSAHPVAVCLTCGCWRRHHRVITARRAAFEQSGGRNHG